MYPIISFKKAFMICLLCWILGTAFAIDYPMILKSTSLPNYHLVYSKTMLINLSATWKILLNNLFTSFILCILGYLSFGLLSIITSIYNGYILGLLMNTFASKYSISSIYLVLLHAPIEVYALCYLGSIGLMGFGNLYNILTYRPFIYFENFPHLKFFLIPVFFLIIAACIESDLVFNIIF